MEHDLKQLKIIVASTPKTGNTWVRHILAAVYNLPMIELSNPFDVSYASRLGDCWIGQEHYYPQSELVNWAKKNRVVVVTTIRHPGDVLVSFCYYVWDCVHNKKITGYGLSPIMMSIADDKVPIGSNAENYVKTEFQSLLNISLAWIYSGFSKIIRYEDLWFDPVQTIKLLTDQIAPVSNDTIERAIEQSDMKWVQRLSTIHGQFFRRGGTGGWREELPPEIIQLFSGHEPYPVQFSALGYTLAPTDLHTNRVTKSRVFEHPFRAVTHFDNGVSVPAVAVRLYLSFPTATARQRWPRVNETREPASFFAWLNAPADEDPLHFPSPLITNLAIYLHRIRADLKTIFPDIFGKDRIDYALWFVQRAAVEHELDLEFTRQVHRSLLLWASGLDTNDIGLNANVPRLTQLAAHVYCKRPDLQSELPDLYGKHRIRYANWFIQHAAQDAGLDPAFIEPMRNVFREWGIGPDPHDPQKGSDYPIISNLASYIYHVRQDLQQYMPDLYGKDRIEYHVWFHQHAVNEYHLDVDMVEPMWKSFLRWANLPDPKDPHYEHGLPLITNFATFVYWRDPVLQSMFPDLYGVDREDYLMCLLLQPQIIELDGYEFTRPIVRSWALAVAKQNDFHVDSGEAG